MRVLRGSVGHSSLVGHVGKDKVALAALRQAHRALTTMKSIFPSAQQHSGPQKARDLSIVALSDERVLRADAVACESLEVLVHLLRRFTPTVSASTASSGSGAASGVDGTFATAPLRPLRPLRKKGRQSKGRWIWE